MMLYERCSRIANLLVGHRRQNLTNQEEAELQEWMADAANNHLLFREMNSQEAIDRQLEQLYAADKEAGWQKLLQALPPGTVKTKRPAGYLAAAALLITITAACWWLALPQQPVSNPQLPLAQQSQQQRYKNDIAPGSNRAILTLAGGATIVLDSGKRGVIAHEYHTRIVNHSNGQLSYQPMAGKKTNVPVMYHTITTPRGGQYHVQLPDGSDVWLNAGSSLRFPAAFTARNRTVTLSGEAYFEVAKNAAQPFRVTVLAAPGGEPGATIRVLGTHFNIQAYGGERGIQTTLLEGSLQILPAGTKQPPVLLKPGQQAWLPLHNNTLPVQVVQKPDAVTVIAWKSGRFEFTNASIEEIMYSLANWYNITVLYKGKVNQHFTGSIPRKVHISKLLALLEITGSVRFAIDGQTVTVLSQPG